MVVNKGELMQTIRRYLCFIGFSIQMVLGILWMICALAGFQRLLEGVLCMGSLFLVSSCVFFLIRGVKKPGKWWQDLWLTLCVITFPFVLQVLVYPDKNTLLFVAFISVAGGAVRIAKKKKRMQTVVLSGSLFVALVVLVFLVMGVGFGRTPVSVRFTQRIAWTTLYDNYARLPKTTRKMLPYSLYAESCYEVVGIEERMYPFLVEKQGKEKADLALAELRKAALQNEWKRIAKDVTWDLAGNTLSPVVVNLQLGGRAYESYTGRNVREILLPAPRLGRCYLYYGCWWFAIACVMQLLVSGFRYAVSLRSAKRDKKAVRENRGRLVLLGLPALYLIGFQTAMGAGMMDYKSTLYVLCLWLIWMGDLRYEKE